MGFNSLYVHFPFCETKCHYCDFYSIGAAQTKANDPTQFADALATEARLWAQTLSEPIRFETIFFGGGTPSMTPPETMARALAPLGILSVDPAREWTMEANPSSIERERMRDYRSLGVNRVSMGVQALRDDLLKNLGRVHDTERAFSALNEVFAAGFDNVSVDLLCGVPGQSLDELTRTMQRLTEFPITHLSCYLLTLPKTHRMFKDLPSEEMQLEHLLTIDSFMRGQGFDHYEISNFARIKHGVPKERFRALHNMRTWQGRSYLGLGPSAHSFDGEARARFKNISSLHAYAKKLQSGERPIEWRETLTAEQERIETWMLRLRLADGVERAFVEAEGKSARAQTLIEQGLLRTHPDGDSRLQLTPRGFALSDQVIQFLI